MGVSRIIDGYIAKTILMCILLVVLVVTGLYVIFAFVSEASDIGSGNYGFWEAIWYVMLTIPANLALIAPVAGFLGSLIGLGYLANHSELIAMRSGGISIAQISKSVAKAAFWVGLITFFLSAFIGPWTSRLAMIEQISSKNNRSFLLTADSTWLKDGNDF
ncbi:MAG: LptF/LptG family permease, partial [Gammaproteobacteria bacterium]|nr:LptF/LptG family permease [Gammaproteobacteria bacterium]